MGMGGEGGVKRVGRGKEGEEERKGEGGKGRGPPRVGSHTPMFQILINTLIFLTIIA